MKNEAEQLNSASEWQGSDRYAGIDTYEKVQLKAGTEICALASYSPSGEMNPCEYLFPREELNQIENDSIRLNRGLQIAPWNKPLTEFCSYRSEVVMFALQKDLVLETGKVAENTAYGEGGMTQYYMPKTQFSDCLKNGDLKQVRFGESSKVLLLENSSISITEYEDIVKHNDQLLLRRNLFCHQKAKLDTLEIIQNSPDPESVKKAEDNLKKLNADIADLKQTLKDSIKEIGPVASPLYDSLNKQLSTEIAYRENHPDHLVLNNVVTKRKELSVTDTVLGNSSVNVVVSSEKSRAEEIGENLFRKIDGYKEGSDGNPIDVKRQGLWDVMNINRINQESREMMQTTALRQRDYSQVQTLAFQGRDGTFKECKLSDYFTEASVAKIQNTRNGQLTDLLEMKDGTKAKLYIEGNKAQLYLPQKEEVLVKQVDKLPMDHSQKKALLAGSCMMGMRIDRELNAIVRGNSVPQVTPAKVCHVKRTVSRGIS